MLCFCTHPGQTNEQKTTSVMLGQSLASQKNNQSASTTANPSQRPRRSRVTSCPTPRWKVCCKSLPREREVCIPKGLVAGQSLLGACQQSPRWLLLALQRQTPVPNAPWPPGTLLLRASSANAKSAKGPRRRDLRRAAGDTCHVGTQGRTRVEPEAPQSPFPLPRPQRGSDQGCPEGSSCGEHRKHPTKRRNPKAVSAQPERAAETLGSARAAFPAEAGTGRTEGWQRAPQLPGTPPTLGREPEISLPGGICGREHRVTARPMLEATWNRTPRGTRASYASYESKRVWCPAGPGHEPQAPRRLPADTAPTASGAELQEAGEETCCCRPPCVSPSLISAPEPPRMSRG